MQDGYSKIPTRPGRWESRLCGKGEWYEFDVQQTDAGWRAKRINMRAFTLREWDDLEDWLKRGWQEWREVVLFRL